jgi:hypothetical protein
LVVGCWLLVVGYWLLVVGYWLLVIGYWFENQELTTNIGEMTSNNQPPANNK